jgi:hypothetical protein
VIPLLEKRRSLEERENHTGFKFLVDFDLLIHVKMALEELARIFQDKRPGREEEEHVAMPA